ncbi:MAG TPA: bacteriophage holin [Victivallales bacterium]|nr:bacteriophage holin [Victivallales bacterium]
MKKISVKGLALALGITWGLYMLFLGWVAGFGWGVELMEGMSSLYIGFSPSFIGGIIGAIWGFFDGAIAGILIAFIYNRVSRKK